MSPNKQVVHVSTIHRPTDNRIFHKECATLSEHGFDVTYVVSHTHDETIGSVNVRSIPIAESGFDKLTKSAVRALRIITEFPRDTILHFHDAELLPIAMLAKLKGYKVIYDAHEDTPKQIFHLHWIPRLLKPPVALAAYLSEKIGGWLFDGIVTANETIRSRFPERKAVIVRNYPRIDTSVAAPDDYSRRPPRVIYAGGLTEARGLHEMIKAIGIVNERQPARLVLGGSFHPPVLHDTVSRQPEWQYVDFRGWLSRAELQAQLHTARVGLATLRPEKQYLDATPTKLFEYAAAGLPIVTSDLPASRAFVSEIGCGLIVSPQPDKIAEAITHLLNNPREAEEMGRRGREAVIQKYNWSSEAEELTRLYSRLVEETSDRRTASTA